MQHGSVPTSRHLVKKSRTDEVGVHREHLPTRRVTSGLPVTQAQSRDILSSRIGAAFVRGQVATNNWQGPGNRTDLTGACINAIRKLALKPDQLIQGAQIPGPCQLPRLSARKRSKKIGGNWRPLALQSSITEDSSPPRRRRFAGFPNSTHRVSACCIARDSS